MNSFLPPIPSPCTGVCMLDGEGLCLGCHRSRDEIGRWTTLHDAERRRLMDEELPRRARQRTAR